MKSEKFKATVNSRHKGKAVQDTWLGYETEVSQLLSPNLKLTDRQRSTGNCFGAFYEEIMSSDRTAFMREYVDTSGVGGGGHTEAKMHRVRMVACASKALEAESPWRYQATRQNSRRYRNGRHLMIRPLALVISVCGHGTSLSGLCRKFEWCKWEIGRPNSAPTVPNRQLARLGECLALSLDVVEKAWEEHGYAIPYQFHTVTVR